MKNVDGDVSKHNFRGFTSLKKNLHICEICETNGYEQMRQRSICSSMIKSGKYGGGKKKFIIEGIPTYLSDMEKEEVMQQDL